MATVGPNMYGHERIDIHAKVDSQINMTIRDPSYDRCKANPEAGAAAAANNDARMNRFEDLLLGIARNQQRAEDRTNQVIQNQQQQIQQMKEHLGIEEEDDDSEEDDDDDN